MMNQIVWRLKDNKNAPVIGWKCHSLQTTIFDTATSPGTAMPEEMCFLLSGSANPMTVSIHYNLEDTVCREKSKPESWEMKKGEL